MKTADFKEMFQINESESDYDMAQLADDKDDDVLVLEEVMDDDMEDEEVVIMLDEGDMKDMLPGSHAPAPHEDEEESVSRDWEHDGDHAYFVVYMKDRLDQIPEHSGTTTVGCEKAISYLRKLDKELSDAVRTDEDDKIDEQEAESIRDMIYDYINKLEDAHDKLMGKYKKKAGLKVGKKVVARIKDGQDIKYYIAVGSASGEETLLPVDVEEPSDKQVAQFVEGEQLKNNMKKAAGAGVYLFEDPFLHSITRLLIQGHITNGKDMREMYAELKNKYAFTPREELSIHELLYQKGFPLIKDLGRIGEDAVRPQEGRGFEHATEYFA